MPFLTASRTTPGRRRIVHESIQLRLLHSSAFLSTHVAHVKTRTRVHRVCDDIHRADKKETNSHTITLSNSFISALSPPTCWSTITATGSKTVNHVIRIHNERIHKLFCFARDLHCFDWVPEEMSSEHNLYIIDIIH